jgi:hypothetical protein
MWDFLDLRARMNRNTTAANLKATAKSAAEAACPPKAKKRN